MSPPGPGIGGSGIGPRHPRNAPRVAGLVDFTLHERRLAMNIHRRTALTLMSVGAFTAFTGKVSFAQQAVRTRRSLTGMALNDPDLSTYRDFVGLMRSKDQNQPLSWLGFANQHGSVNGGFNFCPHGDWYLLPWHRAYVSMYET